MQLSPQAFGSPQLMQSLARMDANLQSLRPGEDWGGSERFDGEQGLGLGDGTGVLPGPRRPRRPGRPALPVLRRRADGRRRPRQARPPARRRGRRRRPHPAASSSRRCATRGYLKRGSDGELRLTPEGDAPARQGAAARRRQPDVRPAGPARPAPGRRGGRAVRRDPGVGVRRHRAVGHPAHGRSTAYAAGPPTAAARCVDASRTSRSPRPRRAPRPRSRCSSTRRSRWRWTAAGCR